MPCPLTAFRTSCVATDRADKAEGRRGTRRRDASLVSGSYYASRQGIGTVGRFCRSAFTPMYQPSGCNERMFILATCHCSIVGSQSLRYELSQEFDRSNSFYRNQNNSGPPATQNWQ